MSLSRSNHISDRLPIIFYFVKSAQRWQNCDRKTEVTFTPAKHLKRCRHLHNSLNVCGLCGAKTRVQSEDKHSKDGGWLA